MEGVAQRLAGLEGWGYFVGVRENDDESPTAKVEGKWKWSDLWLRCEGLGCCVEMNRRWL